MDFEAQYMQKPFTRKDRLNELGNKSVSRRGIRGDEVHEFISLSIREGIEKSQAENKKLKECVNFVSKFCRDHAVKDHCKIIMKEIYPEGGE